MSELKKCCRYCSNFRNNTCQLELLKIEYIEDCFKDLFQEDFDKLKDSDFYEFEEAICKNVVIKNPDDFYCKYYT